MEKYFICLANSYKRGGRCISGIEVVIAPGNVLQIVRNQDGTPHWLRPIDGTTAFGEIPNNVAATMPLFSLVRLVNSRPCPQNAHVENVTFDRMECCQRAFPCEIGLLDQLVDNVHQALFMNRGKAVSIENVSAVGYSLMLIHPQDVKAYYDETREKSKNRIKFTYKGVEYDLPVTDPAFLDRFRANTARYSTIPDAYLTLSLGLEFEGWHHKLVAGVIVPECETAQPTQQAAPDDAWFNECEKELERLLDLKEETERQINEVRMRILKEMERTGLQKIATQHFFVSYTPAKTVMQFDSRSFRSENEELYSRYCKPKVKDASIVVRRNREK